MSVRHVYHKAERTPEETARLRADRERYQRAKLTPEQLLAQGGHANFVPLAELLQLHQVAFALKRARQRQKVTLAELERRTGIDQGALSKLENGKNTNPTLDTLYRVALAPGKVIYCTCQDAPEGFDTVGEPPVPARKRMRAGRKRVSASEATAGRDRDERPV